MSRSTRQPMLANPRQPRPSRPRHSMRLGLSCRSPTSQRQITAPSEALPPSPPRPYTPTTRKQNPPASDAIRCSGHCIANHLADTPLRARRRQPSAPPLPLVRDSPRNTRPPPKHQQKISFLRPPLVTVQRLSYRQTMKPECSAHGRTDRQNLAVKGSV